MNEDNAQRRLNDCSECMATGFISARECHSWEATGRIVIHSHQHRHASSAHEHPHSHALSHHPEDATTHEHRH